MKYTRTLHTFLGGIAVSLLFLSSCGSGDKKPVATKEPEPYKKVSPDFNADSAYAFVSTQVAFGPRVNNTPAHKQCGDWMVKMLKAYGAEVTEQKTMIPFNGKNLDVRNIIGAINPKATKRVLLCAHWDSRPYADKDETDKDKPIQGANDGASGVGVLLEVARILKNNPTNVGVDIIFFDAEDLGLNDKSASYCLGSQYWSKHTHIPNYTADYGILLDMVGATNATFAWEGYSTSQARPVMEKVWGIAQNLGYGKHFIYYESGGGIEDDHVHVMRGTGIPTIDIIHYDATTPSSFPEHHHTHRDNMSVIDRNTLKAVGQTVLETLYLGK